jgi:hypothetical protein
MSYCIGSLNLRGGKRAKSHNNNRYFYEFIYNVVLQENLVLFAFQEDAEVRSNSVIDDILGTGIGTKVLRARGWEGFHPPGPDKDSEFSFIWDSNKVQACSVPDKCRNTDNIRLKREPLCGEFATVGRNLYEFRLINIHLFWDEGSQENRLLECGYVKNEIYQEIQAPVPHEGIKHVFTVALGYYNLNCDECNTCGPQNIKTFQKEETTLKPRGAGYSKSYDHFSFDTIHNGSVRTDPPTRIDVLRYCASMELYVENVSDHVPVKLEIF